MSLQRIQSIIAEELAAVNVCILDNLHSPISLIQDIGQHLIHSGGKRLRPQLLLLTARAVGYSGAYHIILAAVIEFIHTATLLHDDVVDHSDRRRGVATANAVWGNEASVLVGDFVYSRAFQMMMTVDNPRVVAILADATNAIAEGEVLQLLHCHDLSTQEVAYEKIIQAKTAVLFATAAELGAVLGRASHSLEVEMQRFGAALGMAFQLVDDVLDYQGDPAAIGKNLGIDLAEGKLTLPLIYVLREGTKEQQALVRAALEKEIEGNAHLSAIQTAIADSGAIAYTYARAQYYVDQALSSLQCLPRTRYLEALEGLCHFAIGRDY